ncbi:MAG TPA: histidine kinase [Gemmatimonadales bacterium]
MQYEIPAATVAEWSAAILQGAVTLGLAALFAALFRRYHKPYFGWFALAWLLYALRLGAIINFLRTENWIWLYWHQVVTGWTALALLWAALVFSQQLVWRNRYLVLVLFPPLWSYVAIYRLDHFILAAGPAVAFLSLATLWTGWAFFKHYRRVGATSAGFLAVALTLWGLHHFDYPFLRARGAWNPWGYYLDILFVLAMGAGILMLVVEDLQRGLAALSALSGDLQRRGHEADVLDGLLESTMTLTAVRGSAMYVAGTGDGHYVRGTGACSAWAGSKPAGAAAEAIERMLRTGRPETARSAPDDPPYAAALPVFRGDEVAGALVIVSDARDPFAALDNQFLVALGQQVGAALQNAELDRRLESRSGELERLATRMVRQHEDERRRLSRELHDETAQVFSAVKMQLGLLRESVAPDLTPRLDRALELVDAGLTSIRNVTNDLRPSLLDELGLVPALRALARHYAERSDLQVELRAGEVTPLSEAAELAVYRALQEGLANVVRHAQARRVDVSLVEEGGILHMYVCDDGRGLPEAIEMSQLEREGHMGLVGMRERLHAIGGQVTIGACAGESGGVELTVSVPTGQATT